MTKTEETVNFSDSQHRSMSGILAAPDVTTDCAVVLCHGFLSNKNSSTNNAITAFLRPQGAATFRFDFWGHGESTTPFDQITVGLAVDQVVAALSLMVTRGYRKLGLVGSSFGGLVALLAAARFRVEQTAPNSDLAAIALKCPVSDFPAMLRGEFGESGMAQWRATNTIPNVAGGAGRIRLPYSFYEDCTGHDAYAAAESLSLSRAASPVHAPTLIVHGDADEYVPVAQSRRLQQALGKSCSLVIIPAADHHFSKPAHFREMVALIGQWMVGHLLTCRTG